MVHYSLAVESKYDHPMLWGSKRTGPDLARVGGKYSDEWHVAHLVNPRDVIPESVMPPYARLLRNELRTDDLASHLKALRTVGVPYTDDMIANARADAYGQASPDGPLAEGSAKRYGDATTCASSTAIPASSRKWTRWSPTSRSWVGSPTRPRNRRRKGDDP